MDFFSIVSVAFISTFIAIILTYNFCKKFGIVDHPGGRKDHTGIIPLAGGPALLASLFVGNYLGIHNTNWAVLTAACLLVTAGIIDDRVGLRAINKFIIQSFSAVLIVIYGGLTVTTIGIGFIDRLLENNLIAQLLTVIAITGLINAFNMIDGIDGLCAGLALACFGFILLSFSMINSDINLDLIHSLAFGSTAISVFLLFNFNLISGKKIFLGDSGSMLIGLLLATTLIQVSEGRWSNNSYFSASLVLWSLSVPVFDTISTATRRILRGVSPMSPDRTHIHHIFMSSGLTPLMTLLCILALSALLYAVGLVLTINLGEKLSIFLWFTTFILYYFIIGTARKRFSPNQAVMNKS